jgi:hypothetical protein
MLLFNVHFVIRPNILFVHKNIFEYVSSLSCLPVSGYYDCGATEGNILHSFLQSRLHTSPNKSRFILVHHSVHHSATDSDTDSVKGYEPVADDKKNIRPLDVIGTSLSSTLKHISPVLLVS